MVARITGNNECGKRSALLMPTNISFEVSLKQAESQTKQKEGLVRSPSKYTPFYFTAK